MDESEIVMNLEGGIPEADVCAMCDLTFDQLDELMDAHGFQKIDGEWIHRDDVFDE